MYWLFFLNCSNFSFHVFLPYPVGYSLPLQIVYKAYGVNIYTLIKKIYPIEKTVISADYWGICC